MRAGQARSRRLHFVSLLKECRLGQSVLKNFIVYFITTQQKPPIARWLVCYDFTLLVSGVFDVCLYDRVRNAGQSPKTPYSTPFQVLLRCFYCFLLSFRVIYIPITASNFGTFYLNQLNNYISPLSLERHKEKTILFFRR